MITFDPAIIFQVLFIRVDFLFFSVPLLALVLAPSIVLLFLRLYSFIQSAPDLILKDR